MEANAEIHSQDLGQAQEVLLKKERKYCTNQGGVKVMMGKPTETADLSSWALTDSGPTVREPAWN